jgi:hypothetical protein
MSSPTQTTPNTTANGGRRRSSGGLYENLLSQKRSNEAYSARRASIEEQGASKGIFGKMWDT